jgi:hypothetical protein
VKGERNGEEDRKSAAEETARLAWAVGGGVWWTEWVGRGRRNRGKPRKPGKDTKVGGGTESKCRMEGQDNRDGTEGGIRDAHSVKHGQECEDGDNTGMIHNDGAEGRKEAGEEGGKLEMGGWWGGGVERPEGQKDRRVKRLD